jgi:hypothetical protein
VTALLIKKKHKNKAALSTVIEIDMDLEEKEDSEEKEDLEEMEDLVEKEDQPPSDAATRVQEVATNEPMIVSPLEPQSIL